MNSVAELRNRLSRVTFARRFFPDLDPWQEKLLRSNHDRILIAAARQSGKSTMCAIIATHEILYNANSLVLVVSRSVRQSGELTTKIKRFYHLLGEPVKAVAERQLSLTLENGSRVVTLPGDEATIRGFSGPSLILIDEAARVPDDVFAAVSPMLAVSGGRLIALSTPSGLNNRFAEWWVDDGHEWERFKTTAADNPRITEEFLAHERKHMTAAEFAQEYEVSFVTDEHQLFTREMLEAAIDDEVRELPALEKLAWRTKE
jgi:hypothetical protein